MAQEQDTQHALLVPWGQFAREIGLLSGMETIQLKQKVYEHTPQAKVIEFLVAILSGAKYLQDISLAAHPLDKDGAVAQAWGQAGWADYTGVSRTLSALSWTEVHEIVKVLEHVSQPFLESELSVLRSQGDQLQYDGDLTGLPVSNTSRTYPNAAYGHMSDEIRLGYRPEWSACKAQRMDGCGCQWSIMLATRFPVHKQKPWCWQLRNAVDSVRGGALNCCISGSKLLSKVVRRLRNGWQVSGLLWQPRKPPNRKPSHNCEQRRTPSVLRFWNAVVCAREGGTACHAKTGQDPSLAE